MQAGDLENHVKEESALLAQNPEVLTTESVQKPTEARTASIGKRSLWRRLRDQRREVAAVIALVVIAIIWFDTGDAENRSDSVSLDPLAGYDAVLSDFTPVGKEQPLRESADPFESSPRNSFSDGLTIPQSSEFAASHSDSASNSPMVNRGSTPAAHASYPEVTPTFNSAASGTHAGNNSGQHHRRVRFAGRIQPAN